MATKLVVLQSAVITEEHDEAGLATDLFKLADEYKSIWHSKLGADPLVDAEPLLVSLLMARSQ